MDQEEIKISELVETENINENDILMIIQNGANKKAKVKNIVTPLQIELGKLFFPIGSTYTTQTNTNPSTILGFGTWKRLKGKVCLGLDEDDEDLNEIGKTGGEKEHILTSNEIPRGKKVLSAKGDWIASQDYMTYETAGAHNNMQPFKVVGYMWLRTA